MSPVDLAHHWLNDAGYHVQREFVLPNGRRVDLAGMNHRSHSIAIEVKADRRDWFRDEKWIDYTPFFDELWFLFPASVWLPLIVRPYGIMTFHDDLLYIIRKADQL